MGEASLIDEVVALAVRCGLSDEVYFRHILTQSHAGKLIEAAEDVTNDFHAAELLGVMFGIGYCVERGYLMTLRDTLLHQNMAGDMPPLERCRREKMAEIGQALRGVNDLHALPDDFASLPVADRLKKAGKVSSAIAYIAERRTRKAKARA